MTKTLWTIGYERVGQSAFVAALQSAGVKTLVDVREIANSRRAGFSKTSLAAALSEVGIGYLHLKALGTPKLGRLAARAGDHKTMSKIFTAKLAEPESQMALAELGEMACKGRVCIMCLEHDWKHCHRAIVAKRLEKDAGLAPAHILPEASLGSGAFEHADGGEHQ
ncbi:DUF488 family protein [Terricaulis sp.]|uniref:DUF488 family protein n=1 Tax=Terricaulis sp. TaxID=2768686 RepID=UPI0037845AC9